MGFGEKWAGWIRWCIPTMRLSILVNGTLSSFFHNTKGLRQRYPLSPHLFFIGMEALNSLIKRVVSGGFLSSCRVKGRGGDGVQISHLMFTDDMLVVCEASQNQMTYLSWLLRWFEAISRLRINLDKSEILPIGWGGEFRCFGI